MSERQKGPSEKDLLEKIQKGIIDDYRDANPPDYLSYASERKVVDLNEYRKKKSDRQ